MSQSTGAESPSFEHLSDLTWKRKVPIFCEDVGNHLEEAPVNPAQKVKKCPDEHRGNSSAALPYKHNVLGIMRGSMRMLE